MPSISGSDNPGPGALPTFGADVNQVTRVARFPVMGGAQLGAAGAEQAQVFGRLSNELGSWGDVVARDEGVRAGKVAGLDPNYRPDADESLKGIARRNAADATYGNTLEAGFRTDVTNAYNAWGALPADKRTPDALAASLSGIKKTYDDSHVFPTIKGEFDNAASGLMLPFMRAAQADQDARLQDQARASFLTNQNSARDTAMRLAALPSSSDADIARQTAQHDAAVDAAVKQGTYTAAQGVAMKADFRQDVLGTRVMTLFANTPDAQKAQFAGNFTAKYNFVGSEDQQQLAARIKALAPNLANEECVTLARQAAGIAGGVTDWRKGLSATEGRLPIGTPVATFLDRAGNPSEYYDGWQGVGLRGNNTTHAGVVAGYTPAGDLQLWEQFAGSGGPRLTTYKRGDPRGGEKDANNYFSINGPDGKPAGTSNPLAGQSVPNPGGLSADTVQRVQGAMASTLRTVASQAEHTQRLALADIGGDQKTIESGFAVPDAEWSAKRAEYGASADPAVAGAFAQADTIRNLYAGFRGLDPSAIEATAATLRGQLAAGANPSQVAIAQAVDKYADKLRSDLDRDPLRRAAADGVIPGLAPLDLSSPGALASSLDKRQAVADQVAARYRIAPPMVTPEEREGLKAVAAEGGPKAVATAAAIAASLRDRAGPFFTAIGGDAPGFAALGRLAATGGDPSFMQDAMWAVGQDHVKGASVERPPAEVMNQAYGTAFGPAFRAIPGYGEGVRSLAASALSAQIAREGWDPKNLPANAITTAYQKAAGATFVGSTQFGGVTTWRPGGGWFGHSEPVLAPPDVRADQFGTVVKAVTDGDLKTLPNRPEAPDGSVMTAAQLQAAHLTSIGPGVYHVSRGDPASEDPQWATAKDGSKFTLDLNALGPALRARAPGAYK